MALTAWGINSPTRASGKERIVDFSPERLQAPLALRLAAMLIDYMLLLSIPLGWLLFGKYLSDGGPALSLGPGVWVAVVILWLLDFLLLPLLRGQTLGKMLTGLTILNIDGSSIRLGRILVRNVLGYLVTALTLGLGFLISAVNSNGRTLHDFISGTIVVRGRKRLV